jgi:hypothetical protein
LEELTVPYFEAVKFVRDVIGVTDVGRISNGPIRVEVHILVENYS